MTTASLLLLAPQLGDAQVWQGGTDANLLEPTNWDTGLVPGDAEGATFNDAAPANAPELAAGDAKTLDRVDLNAGTLTINGDLTVTTELQVGAAGELIVGGAVAGAVLSGGTVMNAGSIDALDNSGTATSSGVIVGEAWNAGGLTNTGSIGTLVNAGGTATNEATGQVLGDSDVTDGSLENKGTLANVWVAGPGGFTNTAEGTAGDVTNEGTSTSAGTIGNLLNTGGSFGNSGTIGGSVVNSADFTSSGSVAGTLINDADTSRIEVGGSVLGGTTVTGGSVISAGALAGVDVQAAGLLQILAQGSAATVLNAGSLEIAAEGGAGAVTNAGGAIGSNAGMIASLSNAGEFDNQGGIAGDASNTGSLTNGGSIGGDVANDGTFVNAASGNVTGRVTSTIALTNAGRISGGIEVNGGTADNALGGRIGGASTLTVGVLENAGEIGAVDVAAGTVFNNRATGQTGAVSNAGTFFNETGGRVASAVNSADFENRGTVTGLVANSGILTNAGAIIGGVNNTGGTTVNAAAATIGATSTISAGALENSGIVDAVQVSVGAAFNNRAGARAGAVTNAGTFLNEAGAQASALGNVGTAENFGTITGSATNSGTLTNAGAINGGVTNTAGSTVNEAGATIGGASTVSGGTLENSGTIASVGVGADGRLNNRAGAVAGAVTNAGAFLNEAGAQAAAVVNSGTGTNLGEIASLQNSGDFTSGGVISGNAASSGAFTNSGGIGGTLTTSGGTTTNEAMGAVAGASSVTGGTLLNQGSVAAVDVAAAGIFWNEGTAGAVTNAGGFENRAGATAGAVVNSGTGLNAGQIASLQNSATFQNSGQIAGAFRNLAGLGTNLATGIVAGATEVQGGIVDNAGRLAGVTIAAAGRLNNQPGGIVGDVVNAGTLMNAATAVAGAVDNSGTGQNDGEIASLVNSGSFTSTGRILGDAVNSNGLTNSGAIGGALRNTAGTTTNFAGGSVAGASAVEGGALLNAGTLAGVTVGGGASFTNQGTGVAGAVSNAGTFSNAAGGITGHLTNSGAGQNAGRIDGLANGGSFDNTGLISANASNSGTLRSSGTVEGNLTNTGSAAMVGSVTGTLENAGTMSVGPVLGSATEGLAVGGALVNNGEIDLTGTLRSGAGGPAALTTGSLSGDGRVKVLVDFDNLTANRIAVAGALSGNVHLDFGNIGDAASGTDILVLSSADGSAVNLTSTVLADPSRITTAFRSGNDIYVRRDFNPAFGGLVGGLAMTQSLVSTLVNQPNRPFVTGGSGEKGCRPGGYLQAYAGRATMRGESTSSMAAGGYESEQKARYSGLRAAWDYGCLGTAFAGARETRIGFQLGLSQGTTDQPIIVPGATTAVGSTETKFRNRTFGVYVVHQLTDKITGDLQLRHNSTKYTFNYTPTVAGIADINLKDTTVKSNGATVAANLSYAGVLNEPGGIFYSLSGGLSHTRNKGMVVKLDAGGTLPTTARMEIDNSQTTLGVVGAQVSKFFESADQTAFGQVFAGAKVFHDFAKAPSARHFDAAGTVTEIKATNSGTFGEVSVGLDYVRDLAPGQDGRGRTLTTNLRLDLRGGARVRSGAGITGAIRIDF